MPRADSRTACRGCAAPPPTAGVQPAVEEPAVEEPVEEPAIPEVLDDAFTLVPRTGAEVQELIDRELAEATEDAAPSIPTVDQMSLGLGLRPRWHGH